MDNGTLLGEFLRARREVTAPGQVGLPCSGNRRTPGLRRQEVAMLAGVSTDYYIRLEQGRERHPSEQVLAALGRALALGPEAAAHLRELARPWPRRSGSADVAVSPHLVRMMNGWPSTAALVVGRWMDVLACNPLAGALYGGQEHGDNLLRLTFMNPAAREFYLDWERVAEARVAHLRAVAGADLDDPRLTELVGELCRESPDFRRMWARHDVFGMPRETKRLRHPDIGELTLTCELFNVNSSPGQQLITVQAEAGSPSEHAMLTLAEMARAAAPARPLLR
ncbi:transcriptional regulator [Microtetraspora sp. NBRC 13810]|uniref:helix-turn-helix transcriptional regulator n=1 Tax=Microtetraspora sp. NBRC 13810 TaxID=3030990 RepID=UPI0024A3CC97|nr:helix-turn-helix transcriptional regulator [Microtetraspora sp. NBRC 13810]GLW07122.1 transcriptional regulator [Microtetraspora sp. NBRC 13810]